MPRPPRTPKTGVPVAADTHRLSRVRTIRMLMAEMAYRGEATKEALRAQWKCSRESVDDYAREASRSLRMDVADHPDELTVRIASFFQAGVADIVSRIQDEIDEDGAVTGKRGKSLVGCKGSMSYQAYAQLMQTAMGGARDLAKLVQDVPTAFMPEDAQGDAATGTGLPSVEVVVKYADVPTDPAPETPAPPAETPPPK